MAVLNEYRTKCINNNIHGIPMVSRDVRFCMCLQVELFNVFIKCFSFYFLVNQPEVNENMRAPRKINMKMTIRLTMMGTMTRSVGIYLSFPTSSWLIPSPFLSTSGGSSLSLRLARQHLHQDIQGVPEYTRSLRIYKVSQNIQGVHEYTRCPKTYN